MLERRACKPGREGAAAGQAAQRRDGVAPPGRQHRPASESPVAENHGDPVAGGSRLGGVSAAAGYDPGPLRPRVSAARRPRTCPCDYVWAVTGSFMA